MIPGYSIVTARAEHLGALPAVELEAATLLRGYAPESVLSETTDAATFAEAQEHGLLWVALAGEEPVGFAIVVMLASDLPHLDAQSGCRGRGGQRVRRWKAARGAVLPEIDQGAFLFARQRIWLKEGPWTGATIASQAEHPEWTGFAESKAPDELRYIDASLDRDGHAAWSHDGSKIAWIRQGAAPRARAG